MKAIARFSTKEQAENFRNRAFELCAKSYMIVEINGYEIHTRRNANKFLEQGYNVY